MMQRLVETLQAHPGLTGLAGTSTSVTFAAVGEVAETLHHPMQIGAWGASIVVAVATIAVLTPKAIERWKRLLGKGDKP